MSTSLNKNRVFITGATGVLGKRVAFLAKLFPGKDAYGFVTNSYKVQHDAFISDWQPKHKNCLEGMKDILQNEK